MYIPLKKKNNHYYFSMYKNAKYLADLTFSFSAVLCIYSLIFKSQVAYLLSACSMLVFFLIFLFS